MCIRDRIKDELLIPFIDLKTEYYDLGLEERNRTDDQVTVESAKATMKYGVAAVSYTHLDVYKRQGFRR